MVRTPLAQFLFAASVALGMCGAALAGESRGEDPGGYEGPRFGGPRYYETPYAFHYDATVEYQKAIEALKAYDYKAAETALGHALTVAPGDANVLYLYGFTLAGEDSLRRARDAFQKALRADPRHIPARRELAIALFKLGDRTGARKELDRLRTDTAACADRCPQAADYQAAIAAVEAVVTD